MANIITRFSNYYKKKGLARTFVRLFEEPYKMLFKSKVILIYAELSEVNDTGPTLPADIVIECKTTYDEALQPDMQKLVDYWEEENMMDKIKELFSKNAILWILKFKGDIATISWSMVGKSRTSWYLPITAHDVYIFDVLTFEEYRGRGFHPLLVNYRLSRLKMAGAHRALAEISTSNKSSLQILKKTIWNKFCEVRRFRVLGRNITIWTQEY